MLTAVELYTFSFSHVLFFTKELIHSAVFLLKGGGKLTPFLKAHLFFETPTLYFPPPFILYSSLRKCIVFKYH